MLWKATLGLKMLNIWLAKKEAAKARKTSSDLSLIERAFQTTMLLCGEFISFLLIFFGGLSYSQIFLYCIAKNLNRNSKIKNGASNCHT